MAVNHNDPSSVAQTQAQPQAGVSQAPYTQSQPQTSNYGGNPSGMGNVNTLLQRSGSVDRTESRSAEALRALRETAKEVIESQGMSHDFDLLRFDRDDNRVGLPSILVVKKATTKSGTVYAVRTLLLETEGLRLRPRTVNVGMQRFDIPTRAQDVYTDVYWNRIVEYITRNKVGQPDPKNPVTIADAGALLVPASFTFIRNTGNAVTFDSSVQRLLVTSVNRCDDVIANANNESPFTIGSVKRNDERLTANVDFTGSDVGAPPQVNVVGVPFRSDITVTMNRKLNSNTQDDEFYEREANFNSVSGYINLEFSPPQQQQPMGNGWGQPQQPTQLFTPTFVITDVSQADWIQAQTPELYLLALSNAYRVTAGTQWVRSFLPNVGVKGIDIRDIGALGYMTQTGQKVDTKSSSFTEESFIELMTALVRPNPTFLIDVDPMGDHAAIENYFVDSAFDGPNKHRAIERLLKSANNLTGGIFGQLFDNSKPIVIPYMQDVHLGYYHDESGEKRDIRDLDVLAMLNLTQGNMQDFFDWYQTFVNTAEPNELRMQRREKFERNYLSKGLTITGRAIRLLFNPVFIEALDEATRRAGLHVDFENVTSIMGGQRFAGNQLVNQYSVSRNANFAFGGGAATTGNGGVYTGVTSQGRIY